MQFEYSSRVQQNLIPASEYVGDHPKPYVYKLESSSGKHLQFIGTSYPNKLSDPTFALIDNVIDEFKPEVILVGNARPLPAGKLGEHEQQLLETDIEDLVRKGADIAYIKRRALEHEIPWVPLETTSQQIFEYLLELGHSQLELFIFFVIRELITHQKRGVSGGFSGFKDYLLSDAFTKQTGFVDFDISEEVLVTGIKQIYGKYISLEDLFADEQLTTLGHPGATPYFMEKPSLVNQIWSESWEFRDKYALEITAKELQHYNRILILYGSSHAVVQEPALRSLMGMT